MVFYIYSAEINGESFQPGDVIGIFDTDPITNQEICVGADTIRYYLSDTTYCKIVTSMNYGISENQSNGFTPGNGFIFKIHSQSLGLIEEVDFSFPYQEYAQSFTKGGVAIVDLTAQLENVICSIQLSVNIPEAGFVTGVNNYFYGDSVTLNATALNGFEFVSWMENDTVISLLPQLSFIIESTRVILAVFEPDLYPPTNLQARVDDNNVILSWDKPDAVNNGEWIHYDDGENSNSVGLTNGGTFYFAAKWTNIYQYDGWGINKVAFFPTSTNAYFTLKIWQGANAGTLLHTQPVGEYEVNEWNEVFLDENLPINVNSPLYVGFECTHISSLKPAGTDDGPATATKGDLISVDASTWYSLKNDNGYDVNWNIQVYLEEVDEQKNTPVALIEAKKAASKKKPEIVIQANTPTENSKFGRSEFLGYKIYCNDWPIANYYQDTSYTHENLEYGDYSYMVRARYDRAQSLPTNIVEVELYPRELQTVFLPSGWSGLSIYPETGSPVLAQLFNQLGDSLIYIGNPTQGMVNDSTGTWNRKSGYFIKVADSSQFQISGTDNFDNYIDISQGWNLVPILSNCNCEPTELITTFTIRAIVEVAGCGVYWPEKTINTLSVLNPGKSYLLFATEPGVLCFPDCK